MIIRSIDAIIRMPDADYIENASIEEKIQGVCTDSRKVVRGSLHIPIHGANSNGHAYVQQAVDNGARAVLWERREVNPPKETVATLADGAAATLQQLAKAYHDQLNMKIVGVVGSNGKTSARDTLASVLAKHFTTQKTLGNYNNEIGVPLTLFSLSENCEAVVVEVGMENLQELSPLTQIVRPDIAITSNVGTAHLENLGTMGNIARAKIEIIKGLGEHGLLVYNGDQQLLRNAVIERQIPGCVKIRMFGKDEQNDVVVYQVRQLLDGLCFSIRDQVYHLDTVGKHQVMNATAVQIAARALGLDKEEMAQGSVSMEKTGLRSEFVGVNQCLILNDSYKSNPQSTLVAMDTVEEFDMPYKLAVLGDMLELGEASDMIHHTLGEDISSYHLQEVLAIGDMACYTAQGTRDNMEYTLVRHSTDKEELLDYLRPYMHEEYMLLVRGSCGMKLDEVVDELIKE